MIVDVYCGRYRETVVKVNAEIVGDIVLSIPCLECEGTGVWDFFPEEISARRCVSCKGTGYQYLGI